MKIKCSLFIIVFSITMISCQSKSEKINLKILNEPSRNVIGNKKTYPLKYYSFTDSLHSRVVLQENYIQDKWQPFKDENFKLGYMDVYFNKEKVIGFIGSVENKFKNNSDELYKNLQSLISSDKNFKQIDLDNNDEFTLCNEWESNNIVLGIRYEKANKYITLAIIYKNELPTFYDKVFYSEFLDLTKLRVNKAEVQLKELNVKPSKSDKDFYKEKFKELKNEYHQKYN